jgi:hypothetical protein
MAAPGGGHPEKHRSCSLLLDGRVKPTAVRIVLLAIVLTVIPEIALAIAGNPYRSLHML